MTIASVPDHLTALKEQVQSIAALAGNRAQVVHDPDHLIALTSSMTPPFIGVVYAGTRAMVSGVERGVAVGRGAGALSVFDLYLCVQAAVLGIKLDTSVQAHQILSDMRAALRDYVMPNGHKLSFDLDRYVGKKDNNHLWMQRWTLPVPMI